MKYYANELKKSSVLSMPSPNEKGGYICNVSSHWLRPSWAKDRRRIQSNWRLAIAWTSFQEKTTARNYVGWLVYTCSGKLVVPPDIKALSGPMLTNQPTECLAVFCKLNRIRQISVDHALSSLCNSPQCVIKHIIHNIRKLAREMPSRNCFNNHDVLMSVYPMLSAKH